MSDDDYSDEQYSDLNYTSDEQEDEPDVDIANQYYAAKEARDEPADAIAAFNKACPELIIGRFVPYLKAPSNRKYSQEKVLELEEQLGQKGEWGFKALKQMMKLHFREQQFAEMTAKYQQLLTYIKSAVTRNYSERSISNILDYISTTKHMDVLKQFYEITLDALQEAKNDRLWFKTKLKLGKLYFDRSDFGALTRTIRELHSSCLNEDGSEDQRKGTQLLEVYALEIQMYTEQKNNKKLKQLYEKSNNVKSSAIPHPLNLGIIRECGGKMHLSEGSPKEAYACFFEAFKNYDEAGSPRRIQCLKYVVLASMLMEQDYINPFDSQEIKPFRNESEIVAMTALVEAYQQKDARAFETVLQSNKASIMDDSFIRDYIEDLLKAIRTQVLIQLIKPYTRIRIPFVSEELNIPAVDVEGLMVALILDERISGHIDQVNQILVLEKPVDNAKYGALDKWRKQLDSLHVTCVNKLE